MAECCVQGADSDEENHEARIDDGIGGRRVTVYGLRWHTRPNWSNRRCRSDWPARTNRCDWPSRPDWSNGQCERQAVHLRPENSRWWVSGYLQYAVDPSGLGLEYHCFISRNLESSRLLVSDSGLWKQRYLHYASAILHLWCKSHRSNKFAHTRWCSLPHITLVHQIPRHHHPSLEQRHPRQNRWLEPERLQRGS